MNPSLCANSTDYNVNPANKSHYFRHQSFKSLYGVALFPDGTGVAAGYNGQHVVRQGNGVWADRSQFCPYPFDAPALAPGDVSNFPLNGAVCERSTGATITSGQALMVGMGGQARGTPAAIAQPTPPTGQPSENWTEEMSAGFWRLLASSFVTDTLGWRTGQFYHVARTIDGGLTWDLERISPFGFFKECNAIAMSPNATIGDGGGVAVGTYDDRDLALVAQGTNHVKKPKILVRVLDPLLGIRWIEPTTVYYAGSGTQSDYQSLLDVKYTGTTGSGEVYWACGTNGILLRSTDGGMTWFQAPEPTIVTPGTFANNTFVATAFVNKDEGVFVGYDTTTASASAFGVRVTGPGSATWTNLSPAGVNALHDVAIHGSTAYAVGTVQTASGPRGRVFSSVLSGGAFGTFAPVAAQPDSLTDGVSPCTIGDTLAHPPVAKIAVTPSGQVWIGGQCGRVWRQYSSGGWQEAKSQTDAHVLDMTPTLGGYVYVTGARLNLTQSSIGRWKP